MNSSRRNTLTPEAKRELDAVDAVLAGGPVAAEHDSLARFATELRHMRPVAGEQFLAALDARVAEGFESGGAERADRGAGARRARLRERRRSMIERFRLRGLGARPAFGLALVMLLALAVALPFALQGGGHAGIKATPMSGGARGGTLARAREEPAIVAERAEPKSRARTDQLGTAGDAAAGPAASTPAPSASPAPARQVERTATLDVGVAPGAVDSKAHQVFTLVSNYGGYVRTSNVSSGSGQGGASFDIRVPSSKLSTVIAGLSAFGHVRSENNTTNDVTEQFSSLQHSISDLRAERASLLKQIAQASGSAKAEELKARLRNVETVLARYERSLRALSNRINYTPLALTLTPEAGAASNGSGELTPGSAAHDAGRILQAALAVLVIAAAALLPLGAVALAAWMIVASGRRRLREQALDAS